MKYKSKILTGLTGMILWSVLAGAGLAQAQSQEVKFDGHGVTLAGTLTMPALAAGKRAPAVLIIVGSRDAARDGLVYGSARQPIYRDLAEALAARGYASLRYDKRCVGASECKKATSYDDYIDDARGALEFLRKQEKVDVKRIFLFGHSEGGLIASTLGANDEQGLAGVVLAAAAGRNQAKLLREQMQNRMTEAGKSPTEIAAYLAKYDRVMRSLTNGRVEFPGEKFDAKDPYESMLLGLIREYEVVVSLLINDPLQVASNIKSPVLILQGKKDVQVAVKDAQYLEESLKRVNHPDTTVQLVDDMDHLLKTNKGPAGTAANMDVSRSLDATMLTILAGWMQKKAN
ncbi:MAG: alpha/beta fold hydrolase [Blastocatellia bacterium]|nr:alpha/beta fold hydrolase [Blastocatellia bacterium]